MKPITIKEFEKLTSKEEMKGQNGYKVIGQDSFNLLKDFVEEFNATDEHDDAYDCLKISKERRGGEIVVAKQYVGLIQLKNGQQIEILPKIDNGDEATSKAAFSRMLRCMKDFDSKAFSMADLDVSEMNLYDVFINMYAKQVDELVKHGLKSQYVPNEENLNAFKGKLDVKKNIMVNHSHQERFYCAFNEYQQNRPENKIIKSTLLKLNRITDSFVNKRLVSQLLTYFELVEPSMNHDADFAKVILDRSTKEYGTIIKWSKIFLKYKSFTNFSGESESRALLFPMDKLFEAYVAKQIKKSFTLDGFKVDAQRNSCYLFDEPRRFNLRPDIMVTKDGKKIILDTKWKLLHRHERDYGIKATDMYQMFAYSKKYDATDIWLLYPMTDELDNGVQISYKESDGTNVRVFFVDVKSKKTNLEKLKSKIMEYTQ